MSQSQLGDLTTPTPAPKEGTPMPVPEIPEKIEVQPPKKKKSMFGSAMSRIPSSLPGLGSKQQSQVSDPNDDKSNSQDLSKSDTTEKKSTGLFGKVSGLKVSTKSMKGAIGSVGNKVGSVTKSVGESVTNKVDVIAQNKEDEPDENGETKKKKGLFGGISRPSLSTLKDAANPISFKDVDQKQKEQRSSQTPQLADKGGRKGSQLQLKIGKAKSEQPRNENQDGPQASTSGGNDLNSRSMKKQIKKLSTQKQLVTTKNGIQIEKTLTEQEVADMIMQQRQEELKKLEDMLNNPDKDEMSPEQIAKIEEEVNAQKIALGAMEGVFGRIQQGQNSSGDEFLDLDDSDERPQGEGPINQDDDIIQQRKDVKRQRELIHRYRSKDLGIKPEEIRKSDFRASLVREDKDPALEEDGDDISKKSITQLIILKHDNKFLEFWSFLNIFSCLTSSYFYAYISAFGVPEVGSVLSVIVFTYEIIFFIKMMLCFITEYKPEGDLAEPVRDIQEISMIYLKGHFIYDFIPILPLGEAIKFQNGYERLFYLIKIIRIGKGLVIFTTSNIMSVFKNYYQKKVKHIIKNDPFLANNMLQDNNNITKLLMINYGVQITRLVLIICNVSFFLGIFWYILCDLIKDFKAEGLKDQDPEVYNVENFIEYNELQDMTPTLRTIIMMYYMFTSLSTVGFGDFHPRGDEERFICAIILLFGVAIFSYFMGILFEILENFKMLNDDLDDGDELSKFFGLIRHFNDNVPIDSGLKCRIEAHFDYRWAKDKNQAIDDENDRQILDELPEHVQNEIYRSFLFSSFLQKFMDFFTIEKQTPESSHNQGKQPQFYSWEDSDYRDFMMEFLQNLEPRRELAGCILFEELEEINEIFFVSEGQIEIGFELNKQRKFVIRYSNKTVIGGYNCTHDKRSIFVYRCRTTCEGYTIRKEQWLQILEEFDKIRITIERNVETDYIQNIMVKVLNAKKALMKKLQRRADVQQLVTLLPNSLVNDTTSQDKRNYNLTLSNRFTLENQDLNSEPEDSEENCLEEEQEAYEQGINIVENRTSRIINQIDQFNHKNMDLVNKIAKLKKQLIKEQSKFIDLERQISKSQESPLKTVQFSDIEELGLSSENQSDEIGEIEAGLQERGSSQMPLSPSNINTNLKKPVQFETTQNLLNNDQIDAQDINNISFDNNKGFVKQKKQSEDLLELHREKYSSYLEMSRNDHESDKWDYECILQEMRDHPIKCKKYNYSIANNIQNHQQYDASITINKSGDELLISNNKPDTNPEYIFENYPWEVALDVELYRQRKAEEKEELEKISPEELKKEKKLLDGDNSSTPSQSLSDHNSDEYTNSDHEGGKALDPSKIKSKSDDINEEEEEEPTSNQKRQQSSKSYYSIASSASTKIEDIQGLIFGGISSRFWMFRKHMICLDIARDLKIKADKNDQFALQKAKVPFYAWQCITLITKDRYVDLVIPDDQSMDLFMRFLIYALNTIDGLKNSAERTLQAATMCEVARQEKDLVKSYRTNQLRSKQLVLSTRAQFLIREQKKRIVYRKTAFKYIVMRIRCKISYHAFVKKMAINELLISTIYASYMQLSGSGSIPKIADYSAECLESFDKELNCDSTSKTGLLHYLKELNKDPIMRERKNKNYIQLEMKALGIRSIDDLPSEKHKQQFIKMIEENTALLEEASPVSKKSQSPIDVELDSAAKAEEQAKAAQNLDKALGGFDLFDKSKCQDVFEKVVVDDIQMYEQMSMRLKYRKKFQQKLLGQKLGKIKLMMAVGGLQDIFFIKCCLKKIVFIKQMFALDLEKGTEVFIPDELTCDNYPISFRYYDPIILISNEYFSKDSKIYQQMKAEANVVKQPIKEWFLKFTSPVPSQSTTYKHEIINVKEEGELRLQESQHALSLQKSRYLLTEGIQEEMLDKLDYRSIEDKPLNLRFCHVDEVNKKRSKFIHFKHTFYLKQDHLKTQGQKLQTIGIIQTYINNNIEQLYKQRTPKQIQQYHAYLSPINLIKVQKLMNVPWDKMSTSQKGQLERDKQQYAEWLLVQCEQQVHKRRSHMRLNTYQSSQFMCRPGVGFVQKNNYLEERIEATQQYFDYMSDLSHSGADVQKIRKELYRVQKEIEKLKAYRKKIDPMKLLEQFIENNNQQEAR